MNSKVYAHETSEPILLRHEDGSFYVAIAVYEDNGQAVFELYRFTDRDDAEILATTGDFYEVEKDRSRRARTITHEG